MLLLLPLWAQAQDVATCTAMVAPADLDQVLADAEEAYRELDEPGFLDSVDTAFIRTPCLDRAASPELAARLHRLVAVRRWGEAPELAVRSLHAAARAAPDLGVEGLVGPSHPLARSWDPTPARTERIPTPMRGELHLDGQVSKRRPVDAPVLAQLVEGDTVRFTALLAPNAPLPDYDAIPAARAPLRWTAAGTAAGTGLLYGLSWTQARQFEQEGLTADELRAAQGRTNGLLVGSGALLVGSLTSAVASLLVR
jgi:hypothetical protein